MKSGELIKQLRQERNIKQKDLAEGILSRSAISKIEHGEHEPSFDTAMKLIDRLGVTLSDFERLFFDRTSVSLLAQYFTNITDTAPNNYHIQKIESLRKHGHQNTGNDTVNNIYIIVENYKDLSNKEINLLRETVMPVWHHFEKIDSWQKTDLYIINDMLFFFQLTDAINITTRALSKIDTTYPELVDLKASFLNNLGLLCLLNAEYEQAITYFSQSIAQAKLVHRYDISITAKIRTALIQHHSDEIKHQLKLLAGLDDQELLNRTKHELALLKSRIMA